MALRDLVIARKEVALDGATFSVRGLSFFDMSRLIRDHRADFMTAVELVKNGTGESMADLGAVLADAVPGLVAAAIALAADEPDAADVVGQLPAPAQLEALMAVGELTFTDPNAVPKFLANLERLVVGVTSAMTTLKRAP